MTITKLTNYGRDLTRSAISDGKNFLNGIEVGAEITLHLPGTVRLAADGVKELVDPFGKVSMRSTDKVGVAISGYEVTKPALFDGAIVRSTVGTYVFTNGEFFDIDLITEYDAGSSWSWEDLDNPEVLYAGVPA